MATSAATLAVDVTSNVASVTEQFARFGDVVGSHLRGIEGSAASVASAFGGLTTVLGGIAGTVATAFSVDAIKSWSDGVVHAAADIQSLAGATGSTVESISKLSNQAKVAGTDFGTFQDAMFKLQKSMGQAKDSSTDAARALQYLGVTAKEPAEAMQQIIDAMAKYEGGVGKAALANALFGKSGQQFLDTLDNMSRLGNINATVTAKQAEEAERLGIQLRTLSVQSTALANILLSDVVPALNEVISRFIDGRAAGLGMWDAFKVGLQGAKTQARDLDATREAVKRYTDQIALIREHQDQGIASPSELARLGQLEGKLKDVTVQLRAMDAVQAASALRWAKSLGDTTDRLDRLAHKATETGKADFAPGGGKKIDEVTNALESLVKSEQNAANAAAKLTEYEKVLVALQDPKLAKLNASQQALASQARSYALTADASNVLRKAVEDSNNLIIALNEQAAHFQANNAAQAKASADAQVRATHDALENAGAELERSYERGLVDLQTYLDQRTSLQLRAFATDKAALANSLAEAKQLRDDAQKAVDNFDPSLYKSDAEQTKARTKAQDDLSRAIKGVTDAQSAYDSALSKGSQIGKDYVEQIVHMSNGVLQSVRSLENEADARVRANEEIGRTTDEIFQLRIARVQEKLAATNLLEQTPELLAYYDKQIDALQRLRGVAVAGENLRAASDSWRQLFSDAASAGANFIENFVQHGSSAFKNLWGDFKSWALKAFAEIAAKTVIVNIAGALGLGSLAGNALGSSGAAGQLGGLSGIGSLYSAGSSLFSAGGAIGGIGSAFSTGYAGAAGVGAAGFYGTGAELGSVAASSLGSGGILAGLQAGLAAVPVAGWVALGALVIAGIAKGLDDGPAVRSASFGSGAGLGAGNPLFRSQSQLGPFGIFNDKWFSDKDQGQAVQQFLGNITTIDNAIAGMIGPDVAQQVKTNLANVTTSFEAGVEHEATSFGTILSDRYRNVLATIDPELGKLADAFQGTGDQFAKFVVDVVGVYESLKNIDTQKLFGQIVSTEDIVALTSEGESVGATFQRLVSVFSLTDSIASSMGEDMNVAFGAMGLASKDAREALITAMGGLDSATAAFTNYLNVAFTDAERAAMTTSKALETLNGVFGDLNIAMPTTWGGLNQIIKGFDLSTDEGRTLYATFIDQVVPAFTAVYGTAQDAANATTDQASANVTVATSSTQAAASAANVATAMWGVVEVFHELRSAADIANEHLGNTINQNDAVLSFAGGDTQGRLTAKFNLITGELNSLEDQLARYQPGGDLSQTDNAFGEVATLQKQINPLQSALGIVSAALGHFADLTTKYGADTANSLYELEQRYHDAQDAAAGNATALGILDASFQSQWNAIIAGTDSGVTGVGEDLSKLVDSLTNTRAGLRGNFLTDAEKVGEATATLSTGFAALGVAVPQSFREFLSLIDGIDLTTEAGRTLFTALQPLTDAFITVHGTAQAAASAVGGVANAFDSTARASLNSSFLTDAQRTAGAWASLNTTFGNLGVAVPATHEAFLNLLDSFDLTTQAGQDAWSAVLGVSDAFIAVHGTAQAAAEAAGQVAAAFDASARASLNSNFLTDAQRSSRAWDDLNRVFGGLGVAVPATHQDFLALLDSFDLTTQSGQQAWSAVLGVADAFVTVHGSAQAAAEAANQVAKAFDASARAQLDASFLTDIEKVSQAETRLETTFGRLGIVIPETHRDFLALVDSFDLSTQAGQEAFTAITGVADAFVTVHGTAQQAADAANHASDAISNMAGTFDELIKRQQQQADERKPLLDWLSKIGLDTSVSPLSSSEQLAQARSNFKGADDGNLTAAADAYLKVARDAYASSGAYRQIYDEVITDVKRRSGQVDTNPPWVQAIVTTMQETSKAQTNTQASLLAQIAGNTGDLLVALDDNTDVTRRSGTTALLSVR